MLHLNNQCNNRCLSNHISHSHKRNLSTNSQCNSNQVWACHNSHISNRTSSQCNSLKCHNKRSRTSTHNLLSHRNSSIDFLV